MSETLQRLKNVISYSQLKAAKLVISEIGDNKSIELVNSKISDKAGITRSVMVTALGLLEVAGLIETKSMGMKGTYIKVIDQDALNQVADF